ncbi:hypothetical protein [Planomonospora sp. ID67723]|uniref:hypothetical protein n=1 Tax=Planomonospora sp. ID67723 TaxID=2738134 RepID=UPI0018C40A0F|nr:hypothetical protein [Planomonospora sp. ID67723]
MVENLQGLIAELRTSGGDGAPVEVKPAAGGLPSSLTSTPSALANLPGGGVIILGLTAPNIRKALRALRNTGLVRRLGGRGQPTAYRQVDA